jgi:deoxyribodipyrimidine photo-lyase
MKKPYRLSLHVFRRDLRLQDNTALIEALQQSEQVIPCFIFDPRQIENNPYKSDACIQFMVQSLGELDRTLKEKQSKLYCFYGIAEDIIDQLLQEQQIDAVFINRDYTPFSRKRDKKIEAYCKKHGKDFHCFSDALLHEPEQILKSDGKPYTIFTPAFRYAATLPVSEPQKNLYKNYYQMPIANENTQTLNNLLLKHHANLAIRGGRDEGLTLIKNISRLTNYSETRNFPALNGTTKLSAHHKFGTVSIREVYTEIVNQFGKYHTLINELYWRDFFTHIGFHFPHVFGASFQQKYSGIKWSQNQKHFQAWCEGKTGFPIVDAGMRELNATGYMHNRVRMITASFLCKDLHIDWREGEKYFAQKLIDYDPAVNNGNWQWASSTGCDAQPYFRVFNPLLQQKKYDPECLYINKWIPELHSFDYPTPIVDHALESQKAKMMYKI